MSVKLTFDPAKDVENVRNHGISLRRAEDFDFAAALYERDDREDYGEVRYNVLGFLDARLYSLTMTEDGDDIRAISLRRVTKDEEKRYRES
jgi:uncharacterized DUF497 family protein